MHERVGAGHCAQQGAAFLELGLEHADEAALIIAMSEHPILLNRPIVAVKADGRATARLCRPPDIVTSLLSSAD